VKKLAFQVGIFPRLVSTRAKLAMLQLLNTPMEAVAEQSNHHTHRCSGTNIFIVVEILYVHFLPFISADCCVVQSSFTKTESRTAEIGGQQQWHATLVHCSPMVNREGIPNPFLVEISRQTVSAQ
jgi:hypothetical protein